MELISQAGALRVDGIDLDPVMIGLAKRRLGTRALVAIADIAAPPMPVASYDVVVDFGAIHLMPDWRTGSARSPACSGQPVGSSSSSRPTPSTAS
jgi:hypothetical protein